MKQMFASADKTHQALDLVFLESFNQMKQGASVHAVTDAGHAERVGSFLVRHRPDEQRIRQFFPVALQIGSWTTQKLPVHMLQCPNQGVLVLLGLPDVFPPSFLVGARVSALPAMLAPEKRAVP